MNLNDSNTKEHSTHRTRLEFIQSNSLQRGQHECRVLIANYFSATLSHVAQRDRPASGEKKEPIAGTRMRFGPA